MTRFGSIAGCAAVVVGMGACALRASAAEQPPAPVLRAEPGNKKEFDRKLRTLPENAVIESGGERFPLAEIKARAVKRHQERMAQAAEHAKQVQARLETRRAELERQQSAELDADNAKVLAELKRLMEGKPRPGSEK